MREVHLDVGAGRGRDGRLRPRSGAMTGRAVLTGSRAPLLIGLGSAVAVGLVLLAGRLSTGGAPVPGVLAVFWLGMLAFAVPSLWRLLSSKCSVGECHLIVVLAGILTTLPKIAISAARPVYSDEIIHWRQTVELSASGHIGAPNALLPVVADYPGLHGLVAFLTQVTGIPSWYLAVGVLIVAKVVLLGGILVLARALGASVRAGALTALLYAMGPNVMFFDSQFAYESLALVCFVWALACLATMTTRGGRGWGLAGLACAEGCVVTHHVTSFALLGVVLVATAASFRRRAGGATLAARRPLVAWTAVYGGLLAAWSLPRIDRLGTYLGTLGESGAQGIGRLLDSVIGSGGAEREATRQLFSSSSSPGWARALAFLAPPVVLALFAVAMWRRRGEAGSPLRRGLDALACSYVLALALIVTPGGTEIGHRAMGFAFLGLAVAIAPWLVRACSAQAGPRTWVRPAAVLALAGVFVGNVSGSALPEAMFPGPATFGVDSRSANTEADALASWVRGTQGPGAKILTDRYLGLVLMRDAASALPPSGTSYWELFFRRGRPEPYVLGELDARGISLIAIDSRMYQDRPLIGHYLAPAEPAAALAGGRIDPGAVRKFSNAPWATRVFSTGRYSVYRFDSRSVDVCAASALPSGFGTPCRKADVR